jgi:hypothetical protein
LEREPKVIEADLVTPAEYALNVKLRIVVAGARGLPLKEKVRNFSHNDNLCIMGGDKYANVLHMIFATHPF